MTNTKADDRPLDSRLVLRVSHPADGTGHGKPCDLSVVVRGVGRAHLATPTPPEHVLRCSGMNLGRKELIKVPEITAIFWIIKLLSTAMGESTSDYLVKRMNPVVAVGFGGIFLVVALIIQFRARTYVPWIYWLAVVMVAVTGTMAADVLHIQFKVPYAVSTPFFAVVLAVVFIAWYRTERTLSIHSIYTPRREAFYWATVMATFAMGTALGDLTATTFHLGYLASAVLFAGLMVIPAVGYLALRDERDPCLLVRLRVDPPPGRIHRRLAGQAPLRGGPGAR